MRTALVLSGGGTRGAYEAGVIHYIRTKLPVRLAEGLRFEIICGSSVGAINSALCASLAQQPVEQGSQLVKLWRDIRNVDIYNRGPYSLGKLVFRTLAGVASHMVGIKGLTRKGDTALDFNAMFDTQPFYRTLRRTLHFGHISRNIRSGWLDALAVAATNMHTGELELFLQKSPSLRHASRITVRNVSISPRHVMASAALPLLFPPVPVRGIYYNDGGLRLNAPLGPAVSLGASRILLIGTQRHAKPDEAETHARLSAPPRRGVGELLGRIFNAVFEDRVDFDWEQLERVNRVLKACAANTSPKTFREICVRARVKPIETLAIAPTADISTLVDDTMRGSYKRLKTVGGLERLILRLLETRPGQGSTLLSYFLFEPAYIQKLIDLGFEDARSQHDRLAAFAERAITEAPVE